MRFPLHRIASGIIVISRNIQHIKTRRCRFVRRIRVRGFVHSRAHKRRYQIKHRAAHAVKHAVIVVCSSAFFVVHPFPLGGGVDDHQVQPGGDRSIAVKVMQIFHHFALDLKSFCFCRFRYFVSDGVHNHTRVVKIPVYHSENIGSVILAPTRGIIELVLVVEPHIPGLLD
ncbi:hypothetical protein SDC9_151187 [bioreactor metagenome]|uniref:Uncharacterized protein n=1 Tax=bioreactor metagenome TaxID=1076179 RepID=A0A645ERQ3_9ZZZZ